MQRASIRKEVHAGCIVFQPSADATKTTPTGLAQCIATTPSWFHPHAGPAFTLLIRDSGTRGNCRILRGEQTRNFNQHLADGFAVLTHASTLKEQDMPPSGRSVQLPPTHTHTHNLNGATATFAPIAEVRHASAALQSCKRTATACCFPPAPFERFHWNFATD